MNIKAFHFHIYFDFSEVALANSMADELRNVDYLEVGRVWDKPVGPHPIGSCQVLVKNEDFYKTMEWFLTNRKGFSIFVHPVTGDDLLDHSDYAMWIGDSYKLNLDMFRKA